MTTEAMTDAQRSLLDRWLGEWWVVADLSWPLGISTWHVNYADGDVIVKASSTSGHLAREIRGYRVLGDRLGDRMPTFLHGDEEHRILVVTFFDGGLVEGTPDEWSPEVYEEAGRLLARFQVTGETSETLAASMIARAERYLDDSVGILPNDDVRELRHRLAAFQPRPLPLVLTHGDWQPRNWMMSAGRLRIIDLGRADYRHWTHDLIRLTTQQFAERPELRDAFLRGFGRPLSAADRFAHDLELLTQAIGTAPWARSVGDAEFEEFGRRLVRRVLAEPPHPE